MFRAGSQHNYGVSQMNLLKPPPFHIFNHFSFSVEFWTPCNCPHLMSECHAQVCSPWIFPQPTWTQVLSFPYFSVTSQPVICNWLVNLSGSSCVNWAEILERPLEIIYYIKKNKIKANSSQLTFDAGEDSEYQELLLPSLLCGYVITYFCYPWRR